MLTNWTDTRARFKSPLTKDIVFLALATVILNVVDAFSTLYATEFMRATEINIFMAWALERGHGFFMLIKLLLISVCVLGMVFATTEPYNKKVVKIVLIIIFISYLLVALYGSIIIVVLL